MRRCIISWAKDGREYYSQGLKRLIPSAKASGHDGDFDRQFLIVSPGLKETEISGISIHRDTPSYFTIPAHGDVPYGFKPALFRMAFKSGFDQVLWCDSTIIIYKSLDYIWQEVKERGVFVGDNPGCPLCFWTSDDALTEMGAPKNCMTDEVMACAIAFDIRHPIAERVFWQWWHYSNDGITFQGKSGSSRPEFRAHRHDQSALSWLTHAHRVQREPYGVVCYHADIPKFPQHILVNTGLGQ